MSAPDKLIQKRKKLQEEEAAASTATVTEPVAGETPLVENPPVVLIAPVEPVNPVVVTPPPVVTEPIRETFEAQFKTAQGLLETAGKDIRETRDDNVRLQTLMREQMETIDALIKKQNTPPPEPPAPPVKPVPDVEGLSDSENDVLAAYEGLEPIFRKLAKQEAISIGNSIAQILREEFTGLVNPVSGKVDTIINTEQQRKASRFETDLNAEINRGFPENPFNCIEIHNSQDFKDWILGQTDYSGNRLVINYDNAITESFDVGLAARIQKEYIRDRSASVPVVPTAPVASVTPVKTTAPIHPDLEDQIVPAQVVSGGVPLTSGNDTVTEEDVIRAGNVYARNRTVENQKVYDDLYVRLQRKLTEKQTASGKK